MAIDLEQLRREVSGTTRPSGTNEGIYREVSWDQHCEDHDCTWDTLWAYMILAVILCECFLWLMLSYKPQAVHRFFSLYDHQLHHTTKNLIFMTGVLGCIVGAFFFLDNIWKAFTTEKRSEWLE